MAEKKLVTATTAGLRDDDQAKGVEEETTTDDSSESQIVQPYDPSEIRIEPLPLSIYQVMRKIKLQEINLQPDFQRHIVWDETRQSRLVESILIRIPLPAFYLDAVDDDNWLVVDGLQRLSTLDRFFNKNELRLKNLQFLADLNDKIFKDLPRTFQRRIEETLLNLYIIRPGTPDKVKFTIFTRLNTGGLVLTAQEIRHAIYQGSATQLLKELAESPAFKSATQNSINSQRMDDRECVLRFFAFHLRDYRTDYKPDLDDFLSEAMQAINAFKSEDYLQELKNLFTDTMRKAEAVFGPYAFRKIYAINDKRMPINKSLFEAWSVALTKYSLEDLVRHRTEIVKEFVSVMNTDTDFGQAISQATGSTSRVRKRFQTIEELLKEVMHQRRSGKGALLEFQTNEELLKRVMT